jgi:hypothetical protein
LARPRYLDELGAARTSFDGTLAQLEAGLQSGPAGQLVEAVPRNGRAHEASVDEAVSARRRGATAEEVSRILEEEVRPRRQRFDAAVNTLLSHQRTEFAVARQHVIEGTERRLDLVALVGLVAVFRQLLTVVASAIKSP